MSKDTEPQPKELYITNYEQLENIDIEPFVGIVLDESSILKNFTGHYRKLLTDVFKHTKYKLCCSATPSPNDLNEIGNHSEFLDVLDAQDMRSKWFVREEGMNNYRLKGHAKADFYGWIASWAIIFDNPADIGFVETGKKFVLPPLNYIQHEVETAPQEGRLFAQGIVNATNFNAELRKTKQQRLELAAKIASETEGQVLIWVKQNEEGEILRKLIPDAVEVKGSDKDADKEQRLLDFAAGKFRILISKAKICGYGMNFQNCGTQIFVAPDFSFEDFYQQVRRSYRFGRHGAVNIHLIITDTMQNARAIIEQKQARFEEMQREINRNVNEHTYGLLNDYTYDEYKDKNVFLMKGDTTIEIKRIPDNSVDLIIYSPPFSSLFTYSNYIHDMGNNENHEDFFKQYSYLLKELYRILKPGRLMCVHTKDLGVYKNSPGYTGMYDFTGEHTHAVLNEGFKLHSKITIWTDPVLEMQRTKTQRLLYKQVTSDSSKTGIGMAEYVTIFKKWEGDEEDWEPITNLDRQNFPLETWQKWASPVWMDIKRTDVLNGKEGTAQGDEKHICLAKGSLVLTKRGYIPIEDIEIGDETLTHTGVWKPIIAKALTQENAEVVKVNAQGVPNLICTPTHKIYARRRKGTWHKDPADAIEWIEAKDLQDSYVNLKLPPVVESPISEQEWWLIGRWIADGHIDARGHQYFISVGKDKLDHFAEKADGYIGAIADHTDQCSCYQIGLKHLSQDARNVLAKCGHGAKNKVIPFEAISLNKELSKAFVDGYLSGDGSYLASGKIMCTSVSRALLLGMAIPMQRVYGKALSIWAGRGERIGEIQGREVHCSQEWQGVISPKFCYSKVTKNEAWKPVKQVTPAENADVYNIEVADDHSYTAEGCIVKNCPLQLSVIERLVHLWSNEGEVVFTPFLGIGSEVYVAVKNNRKGIGCELKDSYFEVAKKNVLNAEQIAMQPTLFD
jgi:DNA modification methylase